MYILAFFVYGIDKRKARKEKRRNRRMNDEKEIDYEKDRLY